MKPWRKKRDPKIVHVIGKFTDFMLGKVFTTKYGDPGSPIITVNIKNTPIANTLIDLGEAIKVTMKEAMLKLKFPGLWPTPTILQMVNRSTIKPKRVVEDIVVSIYSWEYPTDFMITQPKSNLGGYLLILWRPSLATIDSYMSRRSMNMTISHGNCMKNITLYPPTKTLLRLKKLSLVLKETLSDSWGMAATK